jgi:hypothetical protein
MPQGIYGANPIKNIRLFVISSDFIEKSQFSFSQNLITGQGNEKAGGTVLPAF